MPLQADGAWLAPAKINLALHVTGRRDDGYHLLESLVVFTRFGDRVKVEASTEDRFSVVGPFAAGVPADESNLIVRARNLLRSHFVPSTPSVPPDMSGGTEGDWKKRGISGSDHVSIHLEKNLPLASGVGGGSSDAAATLRALASLWGVDREDLEVPARTLGADVPMCLAARPLLARGIGHDLTPVPGFPALALVLVNPGVAVSTPQVFSALARRDGDGLPPLPSGLDFHGVRNWLETTRNDLEPAARAIAPGIDAASAALEKAGSAFTRMSGSGATCFGLFETGNVAKRAAASIRARHPEWFVAATRSMAPEGESNEQD